MLVSEAWSVMNVEMQVLGGLIVATIGGKSATSILFGDATAKLGSEFQHLMDNRQIVWPKCSKRSDVTLGNDDNMNGPVWLGMVKRENMFGLGDPLNCDAP